MYKTYGRLLLLWIVFQFQGRLCLEAVLAQYSYPELSQSGYENGLNGKVFVDRDIGAGGGCGNRAPPHFLD